MAKKILLFAPMAFNLAETTRMIEIAKGIAIMIRREKCSTFSSCLTVGSLRD